MIEMLMKQFLGDIDLNTVKAQAQQFAQSYAQLLQVTQANTERLQRIEAKLDLLLSVQVVPETDVDAAQAPTVHPEQGNDNDYQHHGGNPA